MRPLLARASATCLLYLPPPLLTVPSHNISSLPSLIVPSHTIPSVPVPISTIPSLAVPSHTVPLLTVPSCTVPSQAPCSLSLHSLAIPSRTAPHTLSPHMPSLLSLTVPSHTVPRSLCPCHPLTDHLLHHCHFYFLSVSLWLPHSVPSLSIPSPSAHHSSLPCCLSPHTLPLPH